GEASLTATLGGGTHNLRAVYEGDGNYAGSEGGLASYDIAKAGQADVSISGAIDDALSAIYGDGPFMLTAVGGSGTGSYEWRIESDTSAATIGANSGRVNILAPGGAAVYVRRLGDGDYNPSDEVSVTLNVEKKAVTITGVKAEGKGYNGDTVAAIDLTEAGLEGVLGGDDVVLDASAATAAFAGANAGTGITVSFEGFTVDGGDAGKYALSAQPAPVKADIAKATPIWGSGAEALAAGGIRFGQRVEESALSGSVFGVGSSPLVLEGSLAWAPSDARSLPGEDDTVLNASGYTYNVVFTPEGADAVNYNPVTGSATLAVAKAVPRMAGEGGAHPQGSPIFANPPGNDTLADSAITGSVVYGFGGEPVDAEGVWSWDVANPSSVKFESIGQKTAAALFTPEDARIEALGETAEFVVYSPRTEIKEVPATGVGVYGSRVGDIPFTSDGRVEAVSSAPGAAAEDITGKGSWSWADPDSRLDSTTGTQAAFAVFTPDNPVDFGEPDPEGYLAAEVRLTITVTPAEVSVDRPGDVPVPALRYGEEAISGIGLGSLGYVFSGPAALGDMDITGTLSWEAADPSAVKPGADGYGTSSDEDGKVYSARDDGVYYAPAVFTPGSSYGNAYKPKTVFVKIEVVADGASRAALADEVSFLADGGDSAVLPKINAAGENYPEDALKRLNEALGSAERALAPGAPALSQKDAEDLSAELQAAIEALGHDHPVLSHSAPDGVKGRGENVTISIKGEYGTVTMATLNGRDFVIGAESGGSGSPRGIMLDGRAAGTISKGSLVIDLSPDFIDSLPNGEYVLLAHFEDGYAKGDGRVLFEIARPEDKADGPSGVKKPAGPGGGPGSAGSGSDAGSGAGSTLSPDSTSGSGNSGGKDANPSGGKTTPIEDNEVNPGTSPWVWLAIALAAVALIIIIAALRRRRRRPQDGKN
ncbi:MAG: YDG domain-containing protein, partial [Clostridiales Family XIII bacterium]|nr:YDG domain-containing protein [Clostridiales Family XIII bacterium]